MGRRYRTKGNAQFAGKKDGAWFNFWLLVSSIFILLFIVFARSGVDNFITALISLIGLICLPIAPFLFIVSIIGNSWDKGLPDISKIFKRKEKIVVDPSFKPLLGFEKCSPQFQEYMRREIESGRAEPKTEPQGEFEDATYENNYSEYMGERGGRYTIRYSKKTGRPYRQYY